MVSICNQINIIVVITNVRWVFVFFIIIRFRYLKIQKFKKLPKSNFFIFKKFKKPTRSKFYITNFLRQNFDMTIMNDYIYVVYF